MKVGLSQDLLGNVGPFAGYSSELAQERLIWHLTYMYILEQNSKSCGLNADVGFLSFRSKICFICVCIDQLLLNAIQKLDRCFSASDMWAWPLHIEMK
jgi:hypothetical protein